MRGASGLEVCSLWNDSDETLPLMSGHSVTALRSQSFLVFGGYTSDERLREASALSLDVPSETCKVSRLKILPEGVSGRAGHVAGAFGETGKVFLGFGYDSDRRVLNDSWIGDVVSDELVLTRVENVNVSERRWAAHCVVDNHLIFVHGGWNDAGPLQDAFSFDCRAKKWNKIETKGAVPSARRWHVACSASPLQVMIMGGYDGKKHYSDAWTLDLRAAQWRQLQDTKIGRARHMACQGVVFGGYDAKSAVLGTAFRMADFSPVECPFEMRRAGAGVAAMAEGFVLVGGFDAQNQLTNQVFVVNEKK